MNDPVSVLLHHQNFKEKSLMKKRMPVLPCFSPMPS